MQGYKSSKNQRKIRNRLYRRTPHRFGVVYQSLKARRAYAAAEDARQDIGKEVRG